MARVFGYTRYCGGPRETAKACLQNQGEHVRQYYREFLSHYEWGGLYEEPLDIIASAGAFHKRPAGRVLMRELRRKDTLIADIPYRVANTLKAFAFFSKRIRVMGAHLCILEVSGLPCPADSRTPEGASFYAMLHVADTLRHDMLAGQQAERAATANRHRKHVGPVPFGWRRNIVKNKVEIDPDVARLSEIIYKFARQGHSVRWMQRELEQIYRESRGELYRPDSPLYLWHYTRPTLHKHITFAVEVLGLPADKLPRYTPHATWWRQNTPTVDGEPLSSRTPKT